LPQVRVFVTLKPSLLDAQGRVVQDALHSLGYSDVGDVRIGKYLEIDVALPAGAEAGALDARVKEMCDRLLANPVIENYRYEVVS
jgi:phosphoribosylformylglycinamidine synthase subunit PurS